MIYHEHEAVVINGEVSLWFEEGGRRRGEVRAKATIRPKLRRQTCKRTQAPLKPHQSDTDKRVERKGHV